jgi:hypothetical protein
VQYNYATEVAAGACPGCGRPVILYHHVQLTTGEERRDVTTLETIFCRVCVEEMYSPKVGQTFLSTNLGRQECLPHRAH